MQNSSPLLEDSIIIDIEVDVADLIEAAANFNTRYKFPGVEKFKEDVIDILENEFRFSIVPDSNRNKLVKGHISNRKNSMSLYFNTIYNLADAQPIIDSQGIPNLKAPTSAPYIACFVHFRFSDHRLNPATHLKNLNYLKRNDDNVVNQHSEIQMTVPEENIVVDRNLLRNYYNKALKSLKIQLSTRVVGWVRYYYAIHEDNE